MKRLPLSKRIWAVFALLLLACCALSAWLQVRANQRHEQQVIQRLSSGLATHIAGYSALVQPHDKAQGLNPAAVKELFGKLMDVNPSVEVYLLGLDGRIEGHAAPDGHLKRERIDVAPIRRLLAGERLPIFGDDPRSDSATKVFSAAPLKSGTRDIGYVYVVLMGEAHEALAGHIDEDNLVRTTLWSMALVAGLGLLAGLAAFQWITRPLRQLTRDVQQYQEKAANVGATTDPEHDEIVSLRLAFTQMTRRIDDQWRELSGQDQQRREMVANISHDLRTPLTSLHGYLETLRLKADTLTRDERERYLDVALGQSRKVGRLAQELFELARLECGVVKPEVEAFSLPELVQDVFQKFELAAQSRQQHLVADIAPDLPTVTADLGMIERVLTNLLDNAIRHTPPGGRIEVMLSRNHGAVQVQVSDTGPGIPDALRPNLFVRPWFGSEARGERGGLGLLIVQRILQLHGSAIGLVSAPGRGAVFRFQLG
jgi:signal transduction histidine kinase